jgi:DNA polymerase III delta prime subunit
MQAYLLVGQEINNLQLTINNLAEKFNAKIMEYPLITIEDVRGLNKLIRLTLTEPTSIVVKNIHKTGIEALNAFLKNLEEPQANLYFVLTTPSIRKVLPTIVSRCQIIKIVNDKSQITNGKEIKEFLDMNIQQKIAFSDKIKDRNKAIEFVESLIFFLHDKRDFKNMELLIKTLTGLKANGNVNLQLSNFVIQYV